MWITERDVEKNAEINAQLFPRSDRGKQNNKQRTCLDNPSLTGIRNQYLSLGAIPCWNGPLLSTAFSIYNHAIKLYTAYASLNKPRTKDIQLPAKLTRYNETDTATYTECKRFLKSSGTKRWDMILLYLISAACVCERNYK
jgi:hypothetical protein